MSEELTYDLNEIVDFKSQVPDGEYIVRLVDVELEGLGTDKPYLQATFAIQEGELAGDDFAKRYYLSTFKTKKGATGCFGLSDFRREAAAIGAEAQIKQKFTATEFRKIYAQIFGKKKLKMMKSMQKDGKGKLNEDGTPVMYQRFTIFSLANPEQQLVSVGAGSDPLAELGF